MERKWALILKMYGRLQNYNAMGTQRKTVHVMIQFHVLLMGSAVFEALKRCHNIVLSTLGLLINGTQHSLKIFSS